MGGAGVLTVVVLVTGVYARGRTAQSRQWACVYTQMSACERGEIWTPSVDRTNVNLLVLLSKMLALEGTG